MKIVPKNQNVRPHQVRADDAFEQSVQALDEPLQKVLRAARGTWLILRVAICAKTMRPSATIHVTTMEFVIGKPERPARSRRPFAAGRAPPVRLVRRGRTECRGRSFSPGRLTSTAHATRPVGARRSLTRESPRRERFLVAGQNRALDASSGIPDVLRDAGGIFDGPAARPSRITALSTRRSPAGASTKLYSCCSLAPVRTFWRAGEAATMFFQRARMCGLSRVTALHGAFVVDDYSGEILNLTGVSRE